MAHLKDVRIPRLLLLLTALLSRELLSSFTFISTTASAFQPPLTLTDRNIISSSKWRDNIILRSTEEECSNTNNHNPSSNDNTMDKSINSDRRRFARYAVNAATAGFITQATAASWFNPVVAEAKEKPKRLGGLPKKIRLVGNILDELQRDLMQERWDLVEKYPEQLRSFVPVFTKFTDSAFPSDSATDRELKVALRYEVGRFFSSLVRLRKATNKRSLDEAYVAYSDMSLHFDTYLRMAGLYTYYDQLGYSAKNNEDFFVGLSDLIVYANQKKDPPLVRDLVVLTKGPDMGKTGIVIGIYSDESKNCIVKLDRFMGLREIKVVPLKWVGKRVGEQQPDDVFLIPRVDADT